MKKIAVFLVITLCLIVATTALTGDKKAYHGSFCSSVDPLDDYSYTSLGFKALENDVTVVCPIIRDEVDNDKLPGVYIEVNQYSTANDDLRCNVTWYNEDSAATIRGMSYTRSTGSSGSRQISFNDIGDFTYSGTFSLSAGGEGSMHVRCFLEDNDIIYQYQVVENMYE